MFVVDQDQEITVKLHGILNDWDLCKRKSDLGKERTQSGRSVRDDDYGIAATL